MLICKGDEVSGIPLEEASIPDSMPALSNEHCIGSSYIDAEVPILSPRTCTRENTDLLQLTAIGDKDLELLEMAVYDSYREEDKQCYPYEYLLDCRTKLMRKLQSCQEKIEILENEKLETEIRYKKKNKNHSSVLRCYIICKIKNRENGQVCFGHVSSCCKDNGRHEEHV